MKRIEIVFGVLRVVTDVVAAFAAFALSYRLREMQVDLIPGVQLLEPATTLPSFGEYLQMFVLPSIAVFVILAAFFQLYTLRSTRSAWLEVGRLISVSLLWLVAVMGWYFFVQKQLFYSRALLIHTAAFLIILPILGRASLVLVQRALLRIGYGVRVVASVGRCVLVSDARFVLEHDIHYQYVGHFTNQKELFKAMRKGLDLVIQTDPNPQNEETLSLLNQCRSRHVGYAFLPPILANVPHQLRVESLGLIPLMRFQPTPLDGWGRVCKRIFDVVVSVILLIVLLPLFVIIALATILEGGFPVFYISKRVGEEAKKHIPVLKFRSMVQGADKMKTVLKQKSHRSDGPLFKLQNDPRITRVGKALRRFSIDELPQLFNVLIGHMSLVGPRPHLPEEVRQYTDNQRRVFVVRPGITGLAQISGRSNLLFDEEVRLDLRYVEEWSFLLDLWVLWRTVWVVLGGDGAD